MVLTNPDGPAPLRNSLREKQLRSPRVSRSRLNALSFTVAALAGAIAAVGDFLTENYLSAAAFIALPVASLASLMTDSAWPVSAALSVAVVGRALARRQKR
jgi:hypothetical protein